MDILSVHICCCTTHFSSSMKYHEQYVQLYCILFTSYIIFHSIIFFFLMDPFLLSLVQSLSHVWLFATPWTAACQASLSTTNCQSLLRLISIESVMPSNHLILYHPLLVLHSFCLTSGSFKMSHFFTSCGQSIGVSASASVLLVNIQGWIPLGWTAWTSLLSKGLLSVFSNNTVQKHWLFSTQLSL